MADIQEPTEWSAGIYQFETSDPVIGGPDGLDNLQAKQLAGRANWLRAELSRLGLSLSGHEQGVNPHPQYATKENLDERIEALIGQSPEALDTLKELADALGNDPNFATTVLTGLASKAPLTELNNYPKVYSIFALPTKNVGPITVAEAGEVWVWTAGQYFTGYRSPLCGRSVLGHTLAPLASEVDAMGGTLSKSAYAGLWGYAQENNLVVPQATWDSNRGAHFFVDVSGTQFRVPDARNMFPRFAGTDADTGNERKAGTKQADALRRHSHTLTMFASSTVFPPGSYSAIMQTPGDSPSSATNESGGAETRPTNTAYAPRLHI